MDRLRRWAKKNSKLAFTLSLVIGFIIDAITLNRVDQWFDNIVMLFYIALAGGSIILLYAKRSVIERLVFIRRLDKFYPFIMLFAFGGLFSALVIFYSKSTSFTTNGIFLLILLGLFIGNEYLNKKYHRLIFQFTIFYLAVLSYSVLITPVIIGRIGNAIFLLGVLISLVVIWLYIKILRKSVVPQIGATREKLYKTTIAVLLGFSLLYFANIIPPVPLSLKHIGVYHYIERSADNSYTVYTERPPWYKPFRDFNTTFHKIPGQTIYVFSAVFAPTDLSGTIFHEWAYFDEDKLRWQSMGRSPISISGGRDGGYRGYSFNNRAEPGTWRVDVETRNGQNIGRIRFKVVEVDKQPSIETVTH